MISNNHRAAEPALPERQIEHQPPPAVSYSQMALDALPLIHHMESRFGADPKCARGIVGSAGEKGEWQVTPIWCADAERITGMAADPYDVERTRYQVYAWLCWYGPRVGATTRWELYELYKRGPSGFREWKSRI